MMKPSEGLLPLCPRKPVASEHLPFSSTTERTLPSFDGDSMEPTPERGPMKRYPALLHYDVDIVCAGRSMVLFNGSTNMEGPGDANAYNAGTGDKRFSTFINMAQC
jgi:hypothetical protein